MRRLLLHIILLLYCAVLPSRATTTITRYHYWIDASRAHETTTEITDNKESAEISWSMELADVGEGMHTLYYRVQDSNEEWSVLHTWDFFVKRIVVNDEIKVTSLEYWVDATKKHFTTQDVTDGEASFVLDASDMREGMHSLYYRFKDNEGQYSYLQTWDFFIKRFVVNDDIKVTSLEYWVDDEKAHLTTQEVTDGEASFVLDASDMREGMHTLYYRFEDNEGQYSYLHTWDFFVKRIVVNDEIKVTSLEYWVDDAKAHFTTQDVTDGEASFVLDASDMREGMHTLYYRFEDNEGQYSYVHTWDFFVKRIVVNDDIKVTSLEYWVDDAKAHFTTQEVTDGEASFVLDASDMREGMHTLYYRFEDNEGQYSYLHTWDFFVKRIVVNDDIKVTSLEYWVDDEKAHLTTQEVTDGEASFVLDASDMREGMHTLYYRFKDNEGQYSYLHTWQFFRIHIRKNAVPAVVSCEYWIDDVSQETKHTIPVTGSELTLMFNTRNVLVGAHTIYYRFKDNEEEYGPLYEHSFECITPYKAVYDSTETTTKCSGETFTWQGLSITPTESQNIFTATIKGEDADTIIQLTVTVLPNYPNLEVTHYICAGDSYDWNGNTYNAEGDYKAELKTIHGCDSIVTLHLRHWPFYTNIIDEQSICEGEKYTWQGIDYTLPGDYTKTLKTIHGCDSIVTLRLTVNKKYTTTDTDVDICYGKSFVWNGISYTSSGTYMQNLTSTAGCDSIVTRTITVLPHSESHYEDYIYIGETYSWNGVDYAESGDYSYTTLDSHGCDSTAWLHLIVSDKPLFDSTETTVKCSGETFIWQGKSITPTESNFTFIARILGEETDTIVRLTVTVNPVYLNVEETKYICAGNSYEWNGKTYSAEGDYKAELKTIHGCDSIVTLHLRHWPLYTDVIDERVICEGESLIWEGTTYTEATEQTRTLQTMHGCDSIVTLKLTILPRYENVEWEQYICEGTSFEWDGQIYTDAGDYTRTLKTIRGCDSVVTLHLKHHLRYVMPAEEYEICEGDTLKWNGGHYTKSGNYPLTLSTVHGCDSLVTLRLVVRPQYEKEETRYICIGDTYDWNGKTYSAEGDYKAALKTIHGCDSIVTLHLRHWPVYTDVIDEREICEGETYTWQGTDYTLLGDYTKTLKTIHGCDSTVTLRLTVLPRYGNVEWEQYICEGTSFKWDGQIYTDAGDYTHKLLTVHGCDSIVTLHLRLYPRYEIHLYDTIINGQVYELEEEKYVNSGIYTYRYTTVNGCDSLLYLHLEENDVQITDVTYPLEQCADNDFFLLNFNYIGVAHQGQILFDEKGHAAGLKDTTLTILSNSDIYIPARVRAGEYNCTARLLFRGKEATSRTFVLTVLFPSSVMEQAWDDVVAVLTNSYNGGYDFVAFQWYENGVLLVGETKSYLYRPLITGGEYNVLLTEADGTQLMSCPLIAQKQEDLTLYPTVANPQQLIRCNATAQGQLILYDALGKQLMRMELVHGENQFTAPAESGIYMAKIIMRESNRSKSYKLFIR